MMRMPFAILLPVAILSGRVVGGTVPAASPQEMAAALERRIVSGDGVTLPDAERGIARVAGTVDLAAGDWPEAFLARAGESVCVAVSPFTGCYEFFDETGEVFWTVVPVLPTTENWVAPFRHAEDGPHPDDGLYAPWRLVDVWLLSTTEHTENTEGGGGASSPSKPRHLESHAEFAESAEIFDLDFGFLDNDGLLRFVNNPRGAAGPATNLCITAFSFTETNLFFTAAWPTNEPLPDSTLDLYGSTNLLSPFWTFLSSHPATNPPVEFAVAHASLPWYVEPMQHVHDATCESITNVVASPLDGVTVYTNVFWSCSTNRSPGECGFFRLGTHLDTDGDGLFDAWETLVAGTDPANPDTDGDGVPDGRTAAEWLSHPLWADNGDCTNLVVFLYEPVTNGVAALRFDDLCIPLASNAGPWHLCIPTNAVVDCRLVLGEGAGALLGYGPPEAVVPMRSSGLGLVLPDEVAVPIWCDRPWSVFGGASRNGSCRFARPSLSVRSEETGQASPLNVCIHDPSGIARFSWSVEPPVCTGLCASATGAAWMFDAGTFFIDASDALPGEAETLAGTVVVASEQPPFFGNNVLFGTLRETVFAHLCAGQSDRYCLSCGVAHGAPESARACFHDPWCATKTNLLADCDCAESFVRIGGCGVLRVIGEAVSCCHAHDFFSSRAELLSAPDALGASLSDGRFLGVAPESRSPTIGGFVANCRILGWDDAPFRDVPIRFTCADLGIVPDFADVSVPGDVPPSEYFITNGTLHVARRAAPYPIRLWNESPSDARLVFSFDSPTNGPALFDSSLVTRHSSLVTTNAAPFSALNDDRTVYLDASCSNALATLSLALSDPATNRTFLSESLSVRVVDTAIREEWRVRSATARIAWDFSDAPEDVWIGVGHAGPDGVLTNTLESASSRTPSLSLDLPPGDYAIEAYFPRVYDGVSAAAWSTNTLRIRPIPEFARDVVGVQCGSERRVNIALTNDTFHSDVQWTLSPVVANGPRLFATSNSVAATTSMSGVSNLWVSAGAVPGVYRVTASYPGFTNVTAYVIDPTIDINGDFWRNGTLSDDPHEAFRVSFTNSFGIMIPCNNNDSDNDGDPDCLDVTLNGNLDVHDICPIEISGLGLEDCDNNILSRLSVRLIPFVDDLDSFPNIPFYQKMRIFPDSDSGTEEFGADIDGSGYELEGVPIEQNQVTELFLEGILTGASGCLKLEVYLDDTLIGSDTVRVLVSPFVVNSNIETASHLYLPHDSLFSDFKASVSNAIGQWCSQSEYGNGFIQDHAEIGSTLFPRSDGIQERPTAWGFFADGFKAELGLDFGWFSFFVSGGHGGDLEALPAFPGWPFGRIIAGSKPTGAVSVFSAFFGNQEIQCFGSGLIEIPTDWLIVGHVDEVVSIIPKTNGFFVAVADLMTAIQALEVDASNSDPDISTDANRLFSIYGNPANRGRVEFIQSKLNQAANLLAGALSIQTNEIVRLPVLFKLPQGDSDHYSLVRSERPNSINMVVVSCAGRNPLVIVPDPLSPTMRMQIQNRLMAASGDSISVVFVNTSGLTSGGGEAHCASNLIRKRFQNEN